MMQAERSEVEYWVALARQMREITGSLEWSDLERTASGAAEVDAARALCGVLRREAVRWFKVRRPVEVVAMRREARP